MTYDGKERRRKCTDCVSHLQHSEAIETLKLKAGEHEESLKDKVPYTHFKWAFGIVVSIITAVTMMNYNTMTRVLESSNDVVVKVAVIEADVRGIRESLAQRVLEHDLFKRELLDIRHRLDEAGR